MTNTKDDIANILADQIVNFIQPTETIVEVDYVKNKLIYPDSEEGAYMMRSTKKFQLFKVTDVENIKWPGPKTDGICFNESKITKKTIKEWNETRLINRCTHISFVLLNMKVIAGEKLI